jgi:hypothetical protein
MSDSFLTLDQSTLFYWTLSGLSGSKKRKYREDLNNLSDWAAAVPSTAKPASHTTHITGTGGHSRSKSQAGVPSLVTSTNQGRSSILTNNVKIVSRGVMGSTKVKAEPAQDSEMIYIKSDGGLSDNDEINGEERTFAVNSPPKGKKRVTSEVSLCLVILL